MKLINFLFLCLCVVVVVAENVEPRPPITNEIATIESFENFGRAETALTTRLPNDTIPHHYDVYLQTSIHEANFSFNGHVTILIETLVATARITLHSFLLAFDEINVFYNNGTTELNLYAGYSIDSVNEFLMIDLTQELPANVTCSLNIIFRGTLRNDDAGFYRSSYIDAYGDEIWLATTQFESVDARSAFPCYDEPRLRATFSISIKHHHTMHAISNMPVSNIYVINDYLVTNFEKSVSMPTYLVAFVVSDFYYASNITNDFEHRIYAQPNRINETNFALEAGVITIQAFEDYFGINYTLPKMDQIAIPDFAAGAMENWGLITYRTVYLLYTPGVSTSRDRENVASVISHELAHQWFGNLVTPQWWTYLWLNEGFATFYEYYATHWVYPQMRMDELFVVETLQGVFWSDSFDTTRPMSYYVEKRNDIDRIFDGVAYSKSGSVLRMMHYALTESTFKKGIYNYLTENALGLGTPERLFAGLQEAVDEDNVLPEGVTINDIMSTWTLQKGYPIINVWRNYNNSTLQIEQRRFQMNSFFDPLYLRWWIPINVASSRVRQFNNTEPMDWLPNNTTVLYTPPSNIVFDENDWILINTRQAGYYRVNYDLNNWNMLARELLSGNFEDIIPINRAQLIDDSLMIARANQLSYFSAMNILNYLQNETDLIPWIAANSNLPYLTRLMTGVEFYDYFANLMVRLSGTAYMKYGAREIQGEPHDHKAARTIVMNWSCRFGMGVCLFEARNRLTEHLFGANDTNILIPVEPNLRTHIYCHGLRRSEVRHYRKVWEMLTQSTDTAQRNMLMNGLGCMEDRDKINLVLLNSLNITLFSPADMRRIASAVVANSEQGVTMYMDFIINNYLTIRDRYVTYSLVSNMFSSIAPRVTTTQLLLKFTRITRYFGAYISDSTFNSLMTQIEDNFRWLEQNENSIRNFMTYHNYFDDQIISGSTTAYVSFLTIIITICVTIFNF